jgi:hypothetical protein
MRHPARPAWYRRWMAAPVDGTGNGKLAAEEARLAVIAPGYLARAREVVRRLAIRDDEDTDARAALSAIGYLSVIDLDAPTASRIPLARLVKTTVKRLVAWYLRYFGRQLTAFGQAVANLGGILVDRTERLEEETTSLKGELADLAQRVDHLERGSSRRP